MLPKRDGYSWLSVALVLICLIWGIRSLWIHDVLAWQRLDELQTSLVRTSLGLDIEWFGLGVFYDERMVPPRNSAAEQEMLRTTTPGLTWISEEASSRDMGLACRIGFGFDRDLDERPATFENFTRVRIPLWLIAALVAIRPLRQLYKIRLEQPADRVIATCDESSAPGRRQGGGP